MAEYSFAGNYEWGSVSSRLRRDGPLLFFLALFVFGASRHALFTVAFRVTTPDDADRIHVGACNARRARLAIDLKRDGSPGRPVE